MHPPMVKTCIKCGDDFDTYKGSRYEKCPPCRYGAALRQRGCDSDNPRLQRIVEQLGKRNVSDEDAEKLIIEASALGWNLQMQRPEPTEKSKELYDVMSKMDPQAFRGVDRETFSIFGNTVISSPLYNPNYCTNCGRHTSHGQFGDCFSCKKKNPTAETVVHCNTCSEYTLHKSDGVCISCGERNLRFHLGVKMEQQERNR